MGIAARNSALSFIYSLLRAALTLDTFLIGFRDFFSLGLLRMGEWVLVSARFMLEFFYNWLG